MVKCLADITQIAGEVDVNILLGSKYLADVMSVFRESSLRVHEKTLHNQLVLFFSHLIMGRNTQAVVTQYLDVITITLFCMLRKETNLTEKIANGLIVLMNNAESHGYTTQLAQSIDRAL